MNVVFRYLLDLSFGRVFRRKLHKPTERILPVIRKRSALHKPEPPVHRDRRIKRGRAAGFQADPRIAALARESEQFGEDGLRGALAQVAGAGAHGLEFAVAACGGGGGRQFLEGAHGDQFAHLFGFSAGRGVWRQAPGGEEGDLGPAQAAQVQREHAFGR